MPRERRQSVQADGFLNTPFLLCVTYSPYIPVPSRGSTIHAPSRVPVVAMLFLSVWADAA